MSRKIYLLLMGILFSVIVKTQTIKTTLFNYQNENLTTLCNTFANPTTVSGTNFVHKTSFGTPKFKNIYGKKALLLEAYKQTSSKILATQFFIEYPFKAGYKYKIRIYGEFGFSSNTLTSPLVGVKLSTETPEINSSSACNGPAQKSADIHSTYRNTTLGKEWAWSPYVYEGTEVIDRNFLQILCTPSSDSPNFFIFEVAYIAAIEIVEESPAPVISPPTSGFEGKFYRNTNNGKKFIGMRGKYRQFISDSEMGLNFDLANISFTDITVDPDISLLGDLLAPTQTILYNGEPSDFSSFYIVDEWNNKKYFVEAKRATFPFNVQTVELHCTDISNPVTFEKYKFKISDPAASYNVWVFNSSNGYKVDFDGQLHSIGGGASAYYILSPSLP